MFLVGGFIEFDLKTTTDRIASQLGLTDYQNADFEYIAREIGKNAKALWAEPQRRHRELAELIRQDAINYM